MYHVRGEERCIEFECTDLREGDDLEILRVDGRVISKRILKNLKGGMSWIDLVQDRNRWRALVNAVINTRVQKKNRGVS